MEVTHAHLVRFAADRVNLPAAEARKHRDQVNGLRDRLKTKIDADPDFGLVKMLHAGSVAKGTGLKTVDDLDLAVYVRRADAPADDRLVPWLADRLDEANPNMSRDQFIENDHSVTIEFRGSGLSVDAVPVIYDGKPDDRGDLVNRHTGARVETSIKLHLAFIRSRKQTHGSGYAELIRLTKWWKRNAKNADPNLRCKSFMIELVWAHLVDKGLDISDYPTALSQFFVHLVRDLDEQIAFNDYSKIPARGGDPIEVIDPVNPDNNIVSHLGGADADRLSEAAHTALNAINEARRAPTQGRAEELWRRVFGPSFRI